MEMELRELLSENKNRSDHEIADVLWHLQRRIKKPETISDQPTYVTPVDSIYSIEETRR